MHILVTMYKTVGPHTCVHRLATPDREYHWLKLSDRRKERVRTYWSGRSPSQYLFYHSVDIWEVRPILESRCSITSHDWIKFCVGTLLNIRVERHGEDKYTKRSCGLYRALMKTCIWRVRNTGMLTASAPAALDSVKNRTESTGIR